jgi:hypothetical protein
MVCKEGESPIWKVLIVLSFIMLSAITWGSAPIQKAIEKIHKKYEKQAIQSVCAVAWGKRDVYTMWMQNAFTSGCMVNARAVFAAYTNTKKEHNAVIDEWADGKSERYIKTKDWCEGIARQYIEEGKIQTDLMASVFIDLGCDKLDAKDIEPREEQ